MVRYTKPDALVPTTWDRLAKGDRNRAWSEKDGSIPAQTTVVCVDMDDLVVASLAVLGRQWTTAWDRQQISPRKSSPISPYSE